MKKSSTKKSQANAGENNKKDDDGPKIGIKRKRSTDGLFNLKRRDFGIFVVMYMIFSVLVSKIPSLVSEYLPEPSSSKIYKGFDEFYPYYLSEHSNKTCRILHFIGTSIFVIICVTDPKVIMSILPAMKAGALALPLTMWSDNGLIEGLAMVGTFVLVSRYLSGGYSTSFIVLGVSYGFAWAGHFFFEQNRPATFVYPYLSLISDLKLWTDIVLSMKF